MIKNIIFDFGGVLFEIDYHAPAREFAKLGFNEFKSLYTQQSQTDIFDQLETGKTDAETFFEMMHGYCPQATRQQLEEAWDSILIRLIPEKVEYVGSLKRDGYKTFLLSNTNAIHVASFEKMIERDFGLSSFYQCFDQVYYSNRIGLKKPHRETYLQLCAWNDLLPSETIFIDDSIQHVIGAKEAGLYALHLSESEPLETLVDKALSELNLVQ
jgi:putative hydrolase of the HAD superfamily